jgi:protein-S-isoprenylcysteine O-methyltransferase Ste14
MLKALEHRIPPPLVGLVLAGVMWLLGPLSPALPWDAGARNMLTGVLAAAGVAFDLTALAGFLRARTTVNPLRPGNTSTLVTDGVYRITRNPMYLGMALLLAAWAVYLSTILPAAGPVLFVLYMNRFQIAPEERAMREKFGAACEAYAGQVRRWL